MPVQDCRSRVVEVTTRIASTRYKTGFRNSRHPWTEKNAVLAFVRTDQGVTGVGEAWCDRGTPETVALLIERDLGPLAVGQPVWAIEKVWAQALDSQAMSAKGGILYAAVSALDIALWDALARSSGLPLYRIFGGFSDSVPIYGSGGMYGDGYGPDALARDMAGAMEAGYAGVKIKGGGAALAEDVARVEAVREAIGPDAQLMVDVLFTLDVPHAKRLARALAPFDLHFLEAPTSREDLQGWAEIRAVGGIPLAGPELESGLHVFRNTLEANAVDFLQADATVCGGLTELKRIAALSRSFHRRMTLHCSGSAVALAANAHAAAALETCESIEMHLLHRTLFDRLWAAGYRVSGGRLILPERPGLGIDLMPDDPELKRIG